MKTLFEKFFPPIIQFLVVQQVVKSTIGNNATVGVIIRIVSATDKPSAIGKFILATNNIPAEKKLDLEIYPLKIVSTVI